MYILVLLNSHVHEVPNEHAIATYMRISLEFSLWQISCMQDQIPYRSREGLLRDKQELTLDHGEQRDKGKEQQAGLITN
jgi:hypothetical protein